MLKILSKTNGVNIMSLITKVNSNYNQVNQNIILFEKEGIISEKRFKNTRMIMINKENEKTILLLNILKMLDMPIREKGEDA